MATQTHFTPNLSFLSLRYPMFISFQLIQLKGCLLHFIQHLKGFCCREFLYHLVCHIAVKGSCYF